MTAALRELAWLLDLPGMAVFALVEALCNTAALLRWDADATADVLRPLIFLAVVLLRPGRWLRSLSNPLPSDNRS